jgi:hypothetical protein
MKTKVALMLTFAAVTIGLSVANGQGPVRRLIQNWKFQDAPGYCTGPECQSGLQSPAPFVPVPKTAPAPMPSAKKAAELGSIRGTIVHEVVRHRLRAELLNKGYSVSDATALTSTVSNELIEAAADAAGAPGGFFQQLLQTLITFLQSPQGQALMNALIQALIQIITHGSNVPFPIP